MTPALRASAWSSPVLAAVLCFGCAPLGGLGEDDWRRLRTASAVRTAPAPARPDPGRPPDGTIAPPKPDGGGGPASPSAPSKADRSGPLHLDEVLDSAASRHPTIAAALLERDIASARLLSAQGAFDPRLVARSNVAALGFYENSFSEVAVEQPTAAGGATLFGGYRISTDVVPEYYRDRTNQGGGFRAGVRLPLLRDRAIDRRRAAVEQAGIDLKAAEPSIDRQRLELARAAARAYFDWVAAGLRLAVADEILRIAEDRQAGLAEQQARGLVAPAVVDDNRRLIVQRNIAVVQSQRRLAQTGFALSLFLRDDFDDPVVPHRSRLPADLPLPAPAAENVEEDVRSALQARPELRRLKLTAERLAVDGRLAANDLLPNLDFTAGAGRDIGAAPYKDRRDFELALGVELSIPVGQRDARGRLMQIRAEQERVRQEERLLRDRIAVEVRDAAAAVQAARRQLEQARENVRLNREMQRLETDALRLGASNLLLLNIREQNTADSRAAEVDAWVEYFRARAEYRLAVGRE